MQYEATLQSLRSFFNTGATKPAQARSAALQKLKAAIQLHEQDIYTALFTDLHKSPEECWISENGFAIAEIDAALKHLKKWMKPEKVSSELSSFPSKSYVYKEPLGVVLIIAPWNYPLNLLFSPLIGAIAAGNCVVLKPSEFAPATAAIMRKIIEEVFLPNQVAYIEGRGEEVIPAMMDNFRFDHVFYTGSTQVGTKIYEAAAKKLSPVTLELGGKSPCIIEEDASLQVAARRLVFAKFLNAGQTCVAPDYVLVHQKVMEKFLPLLQETITDFYGGDASKSYDYGRIINDQQFDRLTKYLQHATVAYGGRHNKLEKYIEPTLVTGVTMDQDIMQEEIFGPILPLITFENLQDAKEIIDQNKNPLAFYLFTQSSNKEAEWLNAIPFGGGCINNAAYHLANKNLPFGGRGNSGIGHYHGRFSFDCFSHKKAVLKTATWLDLSVKYPSFKGKLSMLKKLM